MARFLHSHLRRTAPLLVLASLALGTSTTMAAEGASYPKCDREPTESDVSAAKGAFEAGQVSFQEADYDRAILYWEDAFRRDCTAAPLLLNLSRAYELSGQKKSAIAALETFLERRPNHDDRPSIEKRIAVLKKSVSEEPAKPAPPTNEPSTPAPVSAPVENGESEPEEESGPRKPAWPIVVTGVGVTVTVVGLAFWSGGQQAIERCPLVNGRRECASDALANDGKSGEVARNFGIALTVAGAATAITGGVLWIVTWSKKDDAKQTATKEPVFVPVVSPEFTGLSYSGSF